MPRQRKLKIKTLFRQDLFPGKTVYQVPYGLREKARITEKQLLVNLYLFGRIGFELRQLGHDPKQVYFIPGCQRDELEKLNPQIPRIHFEIAITKAAIYLIDKDFHLGYGIYNLGDDKNPITLKDAVTLLEEQGVSSNQYPEYSSRIWGTVWYSFQYLEVEGMLGNLDDLLPFFSEPKELSNFNYSTFESLYARYANVHGSLNREKALTLVSDPDIRVECIIKNRNTASVVIGNPFAPSDDSLAISIPYLALPFSLSDDGKNALKEGLKKNQKDITHFELKFSEQTLSLEVPEFIKQVEFRKVRETTNAFRNHFSTFYQSAMDRFSQVLKEHMIEQEMIIQGVTLSKGAKAALIESIEEKSADCDMKGIRGIFRLLRDSCSNEHTMTLLTSDDEKNRTKGVILHKILQDKEQNDEQDD